MCNLSQRTPALLDSGGSIDVELIPGDPNALGYTAGTLEHQLYLIDPNAGTVTPVLISAPFRRAVGPN